ncbi:SDR family NAD(P)-dependent oxidoreductase [Confluentibacter sediminis]|uniref:SDR family NAD(P)-dependent oxidoreductase n=1 Tax=Confluentibacter sediminis TaxID=2219045 RepID=UPI000DAEFD03|nr:SDR family NAD(P)-dependent oxidoreductase [Confluentibacter sediminis]
MDLGLKDKIIIVTGGSKGIGNGMCNLLKEEGAIPVIVGRNHQNIFHAIKAIHVKNQRASYAFVKLTNHEQCKNAVERVIKEFVKIDGLVNNAGVNDSVGLVSGNYDSFMESIKTNLVHYYLMGHYALPELKKSNGAIVNMGSETSMIGQGRTSGYAASNAGRNALIREWVVELLPYIMVNTAQC